MAVPSWRSAALMCINLYLLSTNLTRGGILPSNGPLTAPVTDPTIPTANSEVDGSTGKVTTKLLVGQPVQVDGVDGRGAAEGEPLKRAGQSKPNHSPKDSGETPHGKHKSASPSKNASVFPSETANPSSKPFFIGEKERLTRLEMFKESFLHELGLRTPPNVTQPKPDLPYVVLNRLLVDREQNDQPRLQDMRPRKIVVFADEVLGDVECGEDVEDSSCFKFEVTDAMDSSVVSSALIWVYITHAPEGSSVVISRPQHHYGNHRVLVTRKLYSQEGWVEVEIPLERHKWNRQRHYFVITTKPLQEGGNRTVSREANKLPMLMLTLTRSEWSYRKRRSTGICTSNQSTCCMKDFTADFEEIGWTTWLIQPVTFNVRYCSGSCSAATRSYITGHAELVALHIEHDIAESDMSLCCVPDEISGMEVIYYDNNVVHTTTMCLIVESCGCM